MKIEGLHPGGSIKFKTAVSLIEDAERKGLLKPGGTVIESSSGNLGAALSMLCAVKKYHFVCVIDPNTSPQNKAYMEAFGAEVVTVKHEDGAGGYLRSRIDYIEKRLEEDPTLCSLQQYKNPANSEAHRTRTAAAITAEFPTVDYLFVGAGTTGTLMGCVQHFKERSPQKDRRGRPGRLSDVRWPSGETPRPRARRQQETRAL